MKPRNDEEEKKRRWYELDGLAPYRDLFVLAGYVLIVAGVAAIGTAFGCVVGGAGLIWIGLKLAGKDEG
jgi:hypothetical protein